MNPNWKDEIKLPFVLPLIFFSFLGNQTGRVHVMPVSFKFEILYIFLFISYSIKLLLLLLLPCLSLSMDDLFRFLKNCVYDFV